MSVKNKNLLKNNLLSRIGVWEFSPEFESIKSVSNPVRSRKKVNLRRGKNFTSTKSCNISSRIDMRMQPSCEVDVRKFDTKKLRKAKELDNCRTVRSHSASSIKDNQIDECPTTVRTRSVSPTPSPPPVNADLPLTKFYSYFSKIIDQFEIIKIFVNRQLDPAESLHELNRQKKRAAEFSVRFSRNNIYQMKRVVNDIKQIIVPYPFDNLAKSDGELLCKKLLLAYQTAIQALQTYINYMKSGESLDVPEKIRELVLLVVDLYLCCEHLSIAQDQIDLLTPCKELIMLLDEKIIEADGKAPATRNENEKTKGSEKEGKRFSMYKTKLTNSGWKKKTEALAKVKFGVPKLSYIKKLKKLEEKTAVPRTTLEIYSQKRQAIPRKTKGTKNVTDENGKAAKISNDRASNFKKTHHTHREVTCQDEDIETVVQGIDDEDVMVSGAGCPEPREIVSSNLYHHPPNSINKYSIRKLLLQAVQEIQDSEKSYVKNLLKSLDHRTSSRDLLQPKNVKLIHMVSNEPIPEEAEEGEIGQGSQIVGKDSKVEAAAENEKQSHNLNEDKWKTALGQPLPPEARTKSEGKLIKVPKEMAKQFLHYKKVLCEYRKNNVMYKKGTKVKPCELVLRISDQIINDVIIEIASGLESENLLDQLYRNELLEVT